MGLVVALLRMLLPGLTGELVEPPLTFAANSAWIVTGLNQGNCAQKRVTLPFVVGRKGFTDQSSGQKQNAKQSQAFD